MLNTTLGELRLLTTPNQGFSNAAPNPGRSASCVGGADSPPNVFHKAQEVHIRINGKLTQLKAVSVGGFVKRHKQAAIAVAVDLLIAGALLADPGDETFFLNFVTGTGHAPAGLGVMALSCVGLCEPGTGGGPGGNRRFQLNDREVLRDCD